jgi:hypothetical protein
MTTSTWTESVADVVARMEAIVEELPRSDGVACFTRLYLEVTKAVQAELGGEAFLDPAFLRHLDIEFAGLFFGALDTLRRSPRDVPPAWVPLFEGRSTRGIAPIQFALAGMNAHINRDLPLALVATCDAMGIEPKAGSPQHADFERVDNILAEVESRVKREYLTGWLNSLDRFLHRFHRINDVVAMWNIRRARAAAWVNGEALWALRADAKLSAEYLLALDRMVALSGRGLLIPADTTLRKVDRWFGRVRRDPLWWA